ALRARHPRVLEEGAQSAPPRIPPRRDRARRRGERQLGRRIVRVQSMSEKLTPEALQAHDSRDMQGLVRSWPDQIRRQRETLARSPWPRREAPSLIAVGALGGSATAAELVRGLVDDTLPIPFLVIREYAWPQAVGPSALCVLSSYSGNTEETL